MRGSTAQIAPNDPHPCTDFCGENFRHDDNNLNKTKTTEMSCVATSSTVKDDVSALFCVLGFHLNKVLRISTAQEESDIELYLHSKIQEYLSAMILCCIKF